MSHNSRSKPPSKQICCAKILNTTCDDYPVIKAPVLLQKFAVQIPIHATIIFPEDEEVIDITKIKNKAFINHCRFVPNKCKHTLNELLLNGFIQHTVHYAVKLPNKETVMKKVTVEIPFDCAVQIEHFKKEPVGDSHPFCELIWADFIAIDEAIKHKHFTQSILYENECREHHHNNGLQTNCRCEECNTCNCEKCHNVQTKKKFTITEFSKKMVVDLTLKLIQEQEVTIE